MNRIARTAPLVFVLAGTMLVGACGGEVTTATTGDVATSTTVAAGGSGAPSAMAATDSTAPTSMPSTAPTRPTSEAVVETTLAPASPLEGTWTASIQDLLSGGRPAGEGGISCDGAQTVTFRAGRNTITGHGTCHMGSVDGSVTYDSSADYRTEGDQIIVTNLVDNSHVTMGGVEMDGAASTFGNGTVSYSVSGGVLTITIDDPDLGPLSQTYTRI